MSDAKPFEPPEKKPRLEAAEAAYNAACEEYSNLQAKLLQQMEKDPNSEIVSVLKNSVEEASTDKDRAWKMLEHEQEQVKKSEARVVKQGC